jgi:hypothetical protein
MNILTLVSKCKKPKLMARKTKARPLIGPGSPLGQTGSTSCGSSFLKARTSLPGLEITEIEDAECWIENQRKLRPPMDAKTARLA